MSADDNTTVSNVSVSCIVNGSDVIPGDYQGATGACKRHSFGLFDSRNGYHMAQSICVMSDPCLQEGLLEE